jgi:hypothetical protein
MTALTPPRPPETSVPARRTPERAPQSIGAWLIRQSHQNDMVLRLPTESGHGSNALFRKANKIQRDPIHLFPDGPIA